MPKGHFFFILNVFLYVERTIFLFQILRATKLVLNDFLIPATDTKIIVL